MVSWDFEWDLQYPLVNVYITIRLVHCHNLPRICGDDIMGESLDKPIPSGNLVQFAIENGHRNSAVRA